MWKKSGFSYESHIIGDGFILVYGEVVKACSRIVVMSTRCVFGRRKFSSRMISLA